MTDSAVKIVNKVPTHVFEWRLHRENVPLIMVVPGSPGMGHFYIPFARKLFQLGKGAYEVSVVSHAGHSPGHRRRNRDGRNWYKLEDQVEHKLAYIRERAKSGNPIILVGHSIGCYMIMQMLKELSPDSVLQAFFLFPTIEDMSNAKRGKELYPVFTWLRFLVLFSVWLASCLPRSFQTWIMRSYFHNSPRDHFDYTVEGAVNLVNTACVNNCFRMAVQELTEVNKLDTDVLDAHIDKISFYYGAKDHWVPPSCFPQMKSRYPEQDIVQCENGYHHAFVLAESNEMAEYVHSKLRLSSHPSGVKLL